MNGLALSTDLMSQILLMKRGVAATYIDKVMDYSPIAYWPMNETSGTTAVCQVNAAQNGTYNSDVSSMGTGTGIGDGNTGVFFDGENDYCDIDTATLAAAFSWSEGSAMIWAQVENAGVWTDGSKLRRLLWIDNGSDLLILFRHTANNRMQLNLTLGVTTEFIFDTAAGGDTAWMCWVFTWSKTDDEFIAYYNGAQFGATATTLGTPSGSTISTAFIGAQTILPLNVWQGYHAHCALFDSVLPEATALDLATV